MQISQASEHGIREILYTSSLGVSDALRMMLLLLVIQVLH
jgi:hypothetical protein